MKKIFVLFFLVFNYCNAQNCEELLNQSYQLYKNGDVKNSIIICENAKKKCNENYSGEINSILSVLYTASGDYEKLEEILYESIKEYQDYYKSSNPIDSSYGLILSKLGYVKLFKTDYKQADSILKIAINILEKTYGKRDIEYLNAVKDLANVNNRMGNYDIAEKQLLEIISIEKENNPSEDINISMSYRFLGEVYAAIGSYSKSEENFLKALSIQNKIIGQENETYVSTLFGLTFLYARTGKKDDLQLENDFMKILNYYKLNEGEGSEFYLLTLNSISEFYLQSKNYDKAEKLLLQLIAIEKKYHKIDDEIYQKTLHSLGNFYLKIQDYEKSEKYYGESLSLTLKKYGENDSYFSTLTQIGGIKRLKSDYENAEALLLKSYTLQKNRNILTDNLSNVASELGRLYYEFGEYKKSEYYLKECIDIEKKLKGPNDISVGIDLFSLADLYDYLGFVSDAETCLLESLAILKYNPDKNKIHIASAKTRLANVYLTSGKYELALKCISDVENAFKNDTFQKIEYASLLFTLGTIYEKKGLFEKSLENYRKSYEITVKQMGNEHPHTLTILSCIASLHRDFNHLNVADSLYELLATRNINEIRKKTIFLSNNQLYENIEREKYKINLLYSFFVKNKNAKSIGAGYNYNLFIKGLIFNKNKEFIAFKQKNQDHNLSALFEEYEKEKKINNQLKLDSKSNDTESRNSDLILENIEKKILSNSKELQNILSKRNIHWKEIRSKLKKDEAVVDFVSFKYYDNKRWTDSTYYASFVIKSNFEFPLFLNLFEESQLSNILLESNSNNTINDLYSNTDLYDLFWRPIDTLLGNVKKVYISSSGLLNKISFSAIILPDNKKLIDKYELLNLTNISTILSDKDNDIKIKSASLFGEINYDEEPFYTLNQNNLKVNDENASFTSIRSLTTRKWNYLSSTGIEINKIDKIINDIKVPTKLYKKSSASEEVLKNMECPSILHIATHGFSFNQIPQKNKIESNYTGTLKTKFQKTIDPLSRVGLIMSGANEMWLKGKPFPNHEDEILTGQEVSDLNLTDCELATLSACQTGLGDIKGSEGVMGLQRAFKLAGVHYLIVSLWEVPDAETADFMQTFYSKWLKDKNEIKDAFRKTQLEMSDKYKEPFKWAAFTLIE